MIMVSDINVKPKRATGQGAGMLLIDIKATVIPMQWTYHSLLYST
jgi:hypothetical protein